MVTKTDAPQLLDVMTRHQIYLEGVKEWQGQQFNAVVQKLRADLRAIFFELDEEKLSSLTKRQLELFIRKLRTTQLQHYSFYTQQVLNDLQQFTKTDSEVNAAIMEDTQEHEKEKADPTSLAALALFLTSRKQKQLWATVLGTPLPSSGDLPEDYLKRFIVGSTLATELLVRRAYANKLSVNDTLKLVVGTQKLNFRDGILLRQAQQASGLVATLIQHAASIVQTDVQSQYFNEYDWVSIIDKKTSAICRERDGNRYVYGKGPLPPAHPWCRSKTVPAERGSKQEPPTFAAWLKQQPVAVKDDLPSIDAPSPLTFAQFKAKLKFILAT